MNVKPIPTRSILNMKHSQLHATHIKDSYSKSEQKKATHTPKKPDSIQDQATNYKRCNQVQLSHLMTL